MIALQYRKRAGEAHNAIDCSFALYDGERLYRPEAWHTGDEVSLLFRCSQEQADAINALEHPEVHVFGMPSFRRESGSDFTVHIQCRVVARRHAANWRDVGKLQTLGLSIALEATHSLWEDVFLWVCCGEKPTWAEEG